MKLKPNNYGIFLGTIFLVFSIFFSVTFIPPIYLIFIQEYLTGIFPHSDTGVEFERISFILDLTIYVIATGIFLLTLHSNRFNNKITLLLFFVIHFFFASGAICWGQQYFKYRNFIGGEGQDIFALHLAIIEAGILYPIIGHFYDEKIKKLADNHA